MRSVPVMLVAALAALGVAAACLITNCPRGGKRAHQEECLRCGPGGEGECVAPGICCGPLAGCLVSPRGPCARARPGQLPPRCLSALHAPLTLPALPCGADQDGIRDGIRDGISAGPGRCVAEGVCCSHDSCRLDGVCFLPDDSDLLTGPEDAALGLAS